MSFEDSVRYAAETVAQAFAFVVLAIVLRSLVLQVVYRTTAFYRGPGFHFVPTRWVVHQKILSVWHENMTRGEVVLWSGVSAFLIGATALLPLSGRQLPGLERPDTLFLFFVLAAGLLETIGVWFEGLEKEWSAALQRQAALAAFSGFGLLSLYVLFVGTGKASLHDIMSTHFLIFRNIGAAVAFVVLLALIPIVVTGGKSIGATGLARMKNRIYEVALTAFAVIVFWNDGILEGPAFFFVLLAKVIFVNVVFELVRNLRVWVRWDRREESIVHGLVAVGMVSLVVLWAGGVL